MAVSVKRVISIFFNRLAECNRFLAYQSRSSQLAVTACSVQVRSLHLNAWCCNKSDAKSEAKDESDENEKIPDEPKKRSVIDVQTSIRYLKSKAYEITYGDALVWKPYRRNHRGPFPPEITRKKCIRKGVLATGNPCPICRDEYLVLHPENVDLLKQFISTYTGEVISYQKTGLCQMQHKNLLVVIQQAWDLGYIEIPIPARKYNYEEYYPQMKSSEETTKRAS